MAISEIALIIVVALMLFGAKNIPEIARTLGKTIAQIKNTTNQIKSEIQKSADLKEFTQIKDDLKENLSIDSDTTNEIAQQIDQVKENIENLKGPIKRQ